jgi:predicted transcriptional regulator
MLVGRNVTRDGASSSNGRVPDKERSFSTRMLAGIKEVSMTMEGVPVGGFRTLGEIDGTNGLRFQAKDSALAVALELLSSHTSGAPIVNDAGNFVGFVSEFDLLGAIESGKDLGQITADKLMNKDHFVADESTTIADAIELMREKHLLNIPVVKQGQVAYSVTRHDLLRARIGLGPGIET